MNFKNFFPPIIFIRWLYGKELYFFGSLLWCSLKAEAKEIAQDFTDPKAEAIGGALGPIANDEMAVYSNPAGLANSHSPRTRNSVHKIVTPGLSLFADKSAVSAFKTHRTKLNRGIQDLASSAIAGNTSTFGASSHSAIIFGPSKSQKTFLISFPASTRLTLEPSSKDPSMSRQETISAGGVNFGMAGRSKIGRVSAGFVLRPHMKYFQEKEISVSDVPGFKQIYDDAKSNSTKSLFLAADVGVNFTAADFWLPTLSLAIRNLPTGCVDTYISQYNAKTYKVCGVKGSASGNETLPNSIRIEPTEARAGFSISPRFKLSGSQRMNLRLTTEVYPLPVVSGGAYYSEPDLPLTRLIHAGAELSFGSLFDEKGLAFFGGIRKGYPSYGISIQTMGISLQYATYKLDTGTQKVPESKARQVIGLSADF